MSYTKADVEAVFGAVGVVIEEEWEKMGARDDADDVVFASPIAPKKGCKLRIDAQEGTTWTVKSEAEGGAPGHAGEKFKAMKLICNIIDPDVQPTIEGSKPRLTVEFQCNVDRYPYLNKKEGTVAWMGRTGLYGLEEALGFEPKFYDATGSEVSPFITRNGRKVAPKDVEGVKRKLNPDFMDAYFTTEDIPTLEFAGKEVYGDVDIERSEQYGDKNVIRRFTAPPVKI